MTTLAEVIREHQPVNSGRPGFWDRCRCGWRQDGAKRGDWADHVGATIEMVWTRAEDVH